MTNGVEKTFDEQFNLMGLSSMGLKNIDAILRLQQEGKVTLTREEIDALTKGKASLVRIYDENRVFSK